MQRRAMIFSLAAAAAMLSAPAHAQLHDAISPTLSPEMARAAFEDAVMNGCVPSASTGQRIASGRYGGKVAANTTADMREQVGAASDESVFDVLSGKGVVAVKEKADRCVVQVYGPPASATVTGLAGRIAAELGFERLASTATAGGFSESLTRTVAGRRVQVLIHGAEPGMPGHKSRFSVVTATVFATPAG